MHLRHCCSKVPLSKWLVLNIIFISITLTLRLCGRDLVADRYSLNVRRSFSSTVTDFVFSSHSDSRAGEGAPRTVDHAVIGGVVAVVVFAMLCLLIVLGRYFARHKGSRYRKCLKTKLLNV